jgi:ethanolamine ammonia-lyase large subunit
MRLILALFAVTFSLYCSAQSGPANAKILSFIAWKSQQINAAENRTVRIANQLTVLRAQNTNNSNDINKLNIEYRVAQSAAQVVRDLTVEDYFNVYLSQYADDPSTIESAAKSLTPEQVATLLKVYLNSRNTPDQAPNQASNF